MHPLEDAAEILRTLPEPQAFLAGFFLNAPFGLQIYRADGHCLLVNKTFEQIFQSVPPPEYNVLKDEVAKQRGVLGLIQRTFAGETIRVPTIWYDPRELKQVKVEKGRRVAIDCCSFPLFDKQGKVAYVGLVFQDVSALKTSEESLATTLRSIGDAVVATDEQGRVTTMNPVAENLTGWKQDEAKGRPLAEVFLIFNEDTGKPVPAPVDRVLRDGVIVGMANHTALQHRDGSRVPISDSAAPIKGSDGKLTGVVLVFRDASAERKSEQVLRESESRFRRLVEVSPDAVFVNRNGRVAYANAACLTLFGAREPGQLVGKSPQDLFHPESHRVVTGRIAKLQDKDTNAPLIEDRILRLDGTVVDVDVAATSYTEGGERLIQVVLRDTTQRKRLEAEQRQLQSRIQHAQKLESLGVLAGGIAHDFNNLLMAIMGHADLAMMRMAPESSARANVEQIEIAARRAADLTRQMLAYSGKGKIQLVPINLTKSVQEMAHLLQVSVSKSAVLKYNFAANIPQIEADPGQITQVVMNLITNASEAIAEKSGVITISTGVMEADRGYLQSCVIDDNLPAGIYTYVEVSDTGMGMSAETRVRIFEPFFTTKFTGRGLGLSAVLGIVRGHKGTLRVYSEPGRGTTIKVLFPVTSRPPLPADADDETERFRGQGTILVVDDEDSIRAVAKMILEEFGFSVMTAEDGRKAVDLYREQGEKISAVLLDMTMPHMDGEETFRELRRINSGVKVVLSSGYSEQDATVQFAGKGLAGFLQKPYRPNQLIELLRKALGQV